MKLLRALRFFLESFYFFFNRIARYAQSKESRNLLKKIPQSSCKAILRSCLFYEAEFGESCATTRPLVTLLEQVSNYITKANIKEKTKSSYHLMMKHLENYGDCNLEDITTEYIQNFITYLESQGLQRGTVRLYFQKLACVLNDAYKNELFDERILRRVKRPKREQSKKSFLTERELKRLFSTAMLEKYDNMKNMFLFSCSTGLRFSDVANLQWKNVKTHNKHLFLEYHQQKTNTNDFIYTLS